MRGKNIKIKDDQRRRARDKNIIDQQKIFILFT